MEKVGKSEVRRVQEMLAELDEVEVAWFKYLGEHGGVV
jgi:hypothetical protein